MPREMSKSYVFCIWCVCVSECPRFRGLSWRVFSWPENGIPKLGHQIFAQSSKELGLGLVSLGGDDPGGGPLGGGLLEGLLVEGLLLEDIVVDGKSGFFHQKMGPDVSDGAVNGEIPIEIHIDFLSLSYHWPYRNPIKVPTNDLLESTLQKGTLLAGTLLEDTLLESTLLERTFLEGTLLETGRMKPSSTL